MADEPDSMLVVERGIPGVRVLPLDQPVSLLGAAPDSHIFVDNPYISLTHELSVREGKRFRIRDLHSKNGTYINGTRLTTEGHLLQRGDKIEMAEGQVLLRFQTRGTTVSLPSAKAASSGALVVDAKSREVWVGGSRLESPLSRKEFDVLNLLVEKRGEACTKDEIAAAGWPERNGGDVGDHEIEQSVRRLRLRLEPDPSQPKYVITVRGYGYKVPQE